MPLDDTLRYSRKRDELVYTTTAIGAEDPSIGNKYQLVDKINKTLTDENKAARLKLDPRFSRLFSPANMGKSAGGEKNGANGDVHTVRAFITETAKQFNAFLAGFGPYTTNDELHVRFFVHGLMLLYNEERVSKMSASDATLQTAFWERT